MDGVRDYAIYRLTLDGHVATWNTGAERHKGYTADEIIGQHFSRFYTDLDVQSGKPMQLLRAAAAEGRVEDEGWRVRKDGSRFWANVVMTALYDETGQATGFAKITRDVTERKVLEEQLRQSVVDVSRSNAELEQFAYMASHDLQEPLRMVASFTQLLSRRYRGKLDQDADEFIGYAVDGATRMQALINALLEYARIGTRVKEPEPVDTAALVDQVIADHSLALEEQAAHIARGDLPTVVGDPVQLRQLFQNLIGNALKYRGADAPNVRVAAERQGDDWLFTVRDNGIGIEPQYAERVFVIFQRLYSQAEHPGTGARAGDLQEDCGTPQRSHLGSFTARPGLDLLVHPSSAIDHRAAFTEDRPSGTAPLERRMRSHPCGVMAPSRRVGIATTPPGVVCEGDPAHATDKRSSRDDSFVR